MSTTSDGPAKLGYFVDKNGEPDEIKNVFVLVIHYDFKNTPEERKGDAEDVERLRQTYELKRSCKFKKIPSPRKEEFLTLISSDDQLLQLFSSDVPSMFILYVLSHGNENGVIATDHLDADNKFVKFTTRDVCTALLNLCKFNNCLKFINFGPCRGEREDCVHFPDDKKFGIETKNGRSTTRISFFPHCEKEFILFYSTVETTMANRDNKEGSWFVRTTCDVLDNLERDTCLADVLTMIQNKVHADSVDQSKASSSGQTPEFKLFPQRKVFVKAIENKKEEDQPTKSKGHFFKWETDSGSPLRGRKATIFYKKLDQQVERMDEALTQNLLFQTILYKTGNTSLEVFYKNLKLEQPDVGCYTTVFFASITENSDDEICVLVEGREVAIGDVVNRFVGPDNENWIGKPKLFFFINQAASTSRDTYKNSTEETKICATTCSGWLVFVALDKESSNHITDILRNSVLKEGTSIQTLLSDILARNQRVSKESRMLLSSTLQYQLDFPERSRFFIKPKFYETDSKVIHSYDSLIHELKTSNKCSWLLSTSPGMGKSTVLLEIANDLRKVMKQKIVVVKLSEFYQFLFENSRCSLTSLLAKALCTSAEKVEELLNAEGKLFVFVDGYDEVCQDYGTQIIKVFRQLVDRSIPFFTTTRPEEEESLLKVLKGTEVVNMVLLPFDDDQQVELMKMVTQQSEKMCKTMHKKFADNQMEDILENPLHLSMACQCQEAATNLYEVYEQVIRMNVSQGLSNKEGFDLANARTRTKIKARIKLLQQYALNRLSLDGNHSKCRNEDNRKINNTGVATVIGKDQVQFCHQTFAEFLVCQKFIDDIQQTGYSELDLFYVRKLKQCLKFFDAYISGTEASDEIRRKMTVFIDNYYIRSEIMQHTFDKSLMNLFVMLASEYFENANWYGQKAEEWRKYLESTVLTSNVTVLNFLVDKPVQPQVLKEMLLFAIKQEGTFRLAILQAIYDKILTLLQEEQADGNELPQSEIIHWLFEAKFKESEKMETAIHLASKNADVEVCRWLVGKGVDVYAKSENGENVLHKTSLNRFYSGEVTKFFLSLGVDACERNEEGFYPFQLALNRRADSAADLLYERVADASGRFRGLNYMHYVLIHADMHTVNRVHEKNPELIKELTDEDESVLHLAARHSTVEICRWLVAHGLDLFAVTKEGNSVLHEACFQKFGSDILNYFMSVAIRLDINKKNTKGQSPLQVALDEGHFKVVETMLRLGADVRGATYQGLNPLHKLVKKSMLIVAKGLHKRNPSLLKEIADRGESVLHLAARFSNLEMCQWLVKVGADVHAVCNEGNSVLHSAVLNKRSGNSIVEYLVSLGVDETMKNENGVSPLQIVLMQLKKEETEMRQAENVLVLSADCTLVQRLVMESKLLLVQKISQFQRDILFELTENGETILHLAARFSDVEMCHWLVENGVDPHALTPDGNNVLHEVSCNDNRQIGSELTKYFISLGIDKQLLNSSQLSPLEVSLKAKNYFVAAELLLAGSNRNKDCDLQNLFWYSIQHSNLPLLQILLEKYSEQRSELGQTCLHLAARHSTLDMSRLLVESGVEIGVLTDLGDSVLHEACRNKEAGWPIVEFFISLGLDANRGNAKKQTPLLVALNG